MIFFFFSGLGFRPIPRTEERSLIWYNGTNATQIDAWVSNVDQFLESEYIRGIRGLASVCHIFSRQSTIHSRKRSMLIQSRWSIPDYLHSSRLPNGGRNQQICEYGQQTLKQDKVCAVDVDKWGPCSPEESYGFNNSAPCVFIKLNRVRQSVDPSSFSKLIFWSFRHEIFFNFSDDFETFSDGFSNFLKRV